MLHPPRVGPGCSLGQSLLGTLPGATARGQGWVATSAPCAQPYCALELPWRWFCAVGGKFCACWGPCVQTRGGRCLASLPQRQTLGFWHLPPRLGLGARCPHVGRACSSGESCPVPTGAGSCCRVPCASGYFQDPWWPVPVAGPDCDVQSWRRPAPDAGRCRACPSPGGETGQVPATDAPQRDRGQSFCALLACCATSGSCSTLSEPWTPNPLRQRRPLSRPNVLGVRTSRDQEKPGGPRAK